jgi:hypothetical protein
MGDAPAHLRAAAIFGAGLIQRALMTLMLNAARLMRPNTPPLPLRFFATEAQARAWLEEMRRSGQ